MELSFVITRDIINKVYPKREVEAHKYQFGSLLVIGGNKTYHGSLIFNAVGAYRTGVDIVKIVAPERPANMVASYSPDMITYPLSGDYIEDKHLGIIKKFEEECDAIVIGGGIGREKKTKETVRNILKGTEKPVVVDADALRCIEKSKIKKNFLLTPHSEEFRNLFDMKPTRKNVEKCAKKYKCTILLTHSKDIISDGKDTLENWTGNQFLTVGGTGDILAGICGSLIAQGNKLFDSACAAAFINGSAGDIAAKTKKQSLMASDVLSYIEKVFI